MIGYVTPQKSELKLREFEVYNAYYCAVCHAIRSRYGQLPRLLLNYDFVFLAMLLASLGDAEDAISEFRCATHPTRRRNIIGASPETDYAADLLVLLAYCNLQDDKQDEHKVLGYAGTAVLGPYYRKAKRRYPAKEALLWVKLRELARFEKDGCAQIDLVSEPFADIMEAAFDWPGLAERNGSEMLRTALKRIGRHLGKWVYLIDAADDLAKDRKSGSYNPLAGEEVPADRLKLNLQLHLAQIAEATDLLPIKKNRAIIENIVYIGLNKRTEDVTRAYAEMTGAAAGGPERNEEVD
ncbi:MAG: DUF5685 family protein [Clostridiales Family XIII bacterium]|jgi:hypothetical protein|nr:DUF5685 family protein [Clostridiales Family XIII bacterium]